MVDKTQFTTAKLSLESLRPILSSLPKCVVPIFQQEDNRLQLIGSAVWVSGKTGNWLVSAYHVFKPAFSGSPLFHGVGAQPRRIVGEFAKDEQADVSVVRLSDVSLDFPNLRKQPIDSGVLVTAQCPPGSQTQEIYHFASGYPWSKSKSARHRKAHKIVPHHHPCRPVANEVQRAVMADHQELLTRPVTIFSYGFYALDKFASQVRIVDPHGMSGGPMWRLSFQLGPLTLVDVSITGVLTDCLVPPTGSIAKSNPYRVLATADSAVALRLIGGA